MLFMVQELTEGGPLCDPMRRENAELAGSSRQLLTSSGDHDRCGRPSAFPPAVLHACAAAGLGPPLTMNTSCYLRAAESAPTADEHGADLVGPVVPGSKSPDRRAPCRTPL
jgi:hypothetical protein